MTAATEPRFGRMIPAMVTPFDENLELDLDQVRALARRLVDGGSDALIINGTTGESPTVFYPQKMKLFEAVVSEVKGEVPIIANVGDNCTADTVDFARDVQKLGVDAFMLVVPYYNKPPQEGLYQHFKTIADAVDLPIILYNIPGRTGINMLPETTLRLANDCENIVAIKEASGDLDQVAEIIKNAPEGFDVYSGDPYLRHDEDRRSRRYLNHGQCCSGAHEGDNHAVRRGQVRRGCSRKREAASPDERAVRYRKSHYGEGSAQPFRLPCWRRTSSLG